MATLSKQAPEGDRWLHEIKFDGYRILAQIEKGQVRLWSRNRQEWTARFRDLARQFAELPIRTAWFDGEVIALDPSGISSFQRLQNSLRERSTGELIYQAFDLLYLDGYDLRPAPLAGRKALLEALLPAPGDAGRVRYTEHFEGDGGEFFRQVCRMGLEGIISKNRDKRYVPGRGTDWLKVKCVQREEFVIGGFTEPAGSRHGFGALLVGYYTNDKQLRYAGKVGTGFNAVMLADLHRRLVKLRQPQSPFVDLGQRKMIRGTHWVRPELVAQVEFTQWTDDQLLRHPSFQGLREDKPATTVRRDIAAEEAPMSAKRARKTRQPTDSEQQVAQGEARVAGVRLSNPDRVLYPERGLTKLGLASYYAQVAEWMLPYLQGRPLSLVRCPQGHHDTCFYQKNLGASAPPQLRAVAVPEKSKIGHYAVVDDVAALVSLVQIGVLEIHIWGSREDSLEKPDVLVFDLDPDTGLAWSAVLDAAREVRELLDALGLQSFVKTTGGKGLHVAAPMRRRHPWPQVKQFARNVAEFIAQRAPDRYTTNMSKKARGGKIFIDYLRNDRGATFICPYSTRAKPQAPVSAPLDWDELSTALRSDHFTVENLPRRLHSLQADPWAEFFQVRQSLTVAAMRKMDDSARGNSSPLR